MARSKEFHVEGRRELPPVDAATFEAGDGAIEVIETFAIPEAELEAFMAEKLEIIVAKDRDPNATPMVQVGVNGRMKLIHRGVRTLIARSYVERLIRANSVAIHQDTKAVKDPDVFNRLERTSGPDYPFSVLHDPSGAKGRAWLESVSAQS